MSVMCSNCGQETTGADCQWCHYSLVGGRPIRIKNGRASKKSKMKVRSSLGSIVFALWGEIEALLRDMLVICYGCWMLYCFLTILLTGELHVFEPSRAMLITEIIVSVLITMAGIRWFMKEIRKK